MGNYVSQNSPHPPPAEIAVSQKNGKESVTKVKTKRRTLKEEKDKPLFLYCPQQTKSKRKSKRNDEHAESLQMCRTTLCKKHLNKWRFILIWSKKNTKFFFFFHKTGFLFFFLTRLNSELIFLFSHRIFSKYITTLMYLFIFISSVVGFIIIALPESIFH